jgi:hypothetical protein
MASEQADELEALEAIFPLPGEFVVHSHSPTLRFAHLTEPRIIS